MDKDYKPAEGGGIGTDSIIRIKITNTPSEEEGFHQFLLVELVRCWQEKGLS